MFVMPDVSPPVAPAVVIDEHWAAARPAIKAPAAAPVKQAMTDPRISAGVAAVLAETPVRDPAPNRQEGLQAVAYGSDAAARLARGFNEAKAGPCLSPATGGLGIFAIPVIAVQALRGKCLMP